MDVREEQNLMTLLNTEPEAIDCTQDESTPLALDLNTVDNFFLSKTQKRKKAATNASKNLKKQVRAHNSSVPALPTHECAVSLD